MTSSIPPLQLTEEPGSYSTCSSNMQGFVFNVDKCPDVNKWIELTSLGTVVITAIGDITITTDVNIDINAINVNMTAELFVPEVFPIPSTKAECVENGIINVNKLLTFYLYNN